MHWAQVKDKYDKGFFHLPRQHKHQQDTSLHEEFNTAPCLQWKTAKRHQTRIIPPWPNVSGYHLTKFWHLGNLHILKQEVKHSLGNRTGASLYHPSALCLLGIASLQDNVTSQAQTFPTLTSSMAVTMQAALLSLGATLQTHGSCLEIIRIKTEERATVSRQRAVLPPITRRQKKRA